MSDFRELIDIRAATPEDYNFIRATFMRGVYYGNSWFEMMPKDVFMRHYKTVIENFLTSPSCAIRVASPKNEPDLIIGYSILSKDFSIVHWVYVKKDWRGKKVGKALLPSAPTSVSHLTDALKDVLKTKYPNTIFNPFKLE